MVEFHGWHMPLHYGSQLQEHQQVRQHAGLFDVSHMTILDMQGSEARLFLRHLLTADIDKLPNTGGALYSCMCNDQGGIIDDLIVYQRDSTLYRIILNSATRSRDLAWIHEHMTPYKVNIHERTDLAMIAIQGPNAITQSLNVLSPTVAHAVSQLESFAYIESDELFIARTGYTGEDGLEIIAPPEQITALWQALVNIGIQPCGLAARDTLRIEAGLLLYGQDMDESITPLESSLGWTITWETTDRHFMGRQALESQKKLGPRYKLVGITLLDKGMLRTGQRVMIAGLPNGIITSGTFSPTLGQSIGFARVPSETPDNVEVDIRDKRMHAHVGKIKFIKKGQSS
jgi:aminomethyltransferase